MLFVYLKIRYTLKLLLSAVVLQACTNIQPEDIIGSWSIDQWVEDGMDRTNQLSSRPWGTAITLAKDGSFRTNGRDNNQGRWKITPNGTLYFLFPQDSGQYEPWKVLLSGDYLVLKATTQQLYLSRTDKVKALPPVVVDLKNNLPGTWYFYQMKTDSGLMQYPQKKRQARWMRIDKSGSYESGEGGSATLSGRWVLNHDTLTFSDFNRPWKRNWKVAIDQKGTLYFHTLADDTAGLEHVSFVNEVNLSW